MLLVSHSGCMTTCLIFALRLESSQGLFLFAFLHSAQMDGTVGSPIIRLSVQKLQLSCSHFKRNYMDTLETCSEFSGAVDFVTYCLSPGYFPLALRFFFFFFLIEDNYLKQLKQGFLLYK